MTLVLGYDGGVSARLALPVAIELARDLGTDLAVVCGVAPPGSLGEEYVAMEEAVVEEVFPDVQRAVEQAQAGGVATTAHLVDAEPAEALITVAERTGARLIVVGYGASGRIRAAIMGAVAHKVVAEATCPVLVVPEGDDDPDEDPDEAPEDEAIEPGQDAASDEVG